MAQAKVTEFFSTRKRNRIVHDEMLLNKNRNADLGSPATTIDADDIDLIKKKFVQEVTKTTTTRTLRSRATKHETIETKVVKVVDNIQVQKQENDKNNEENNSEEPAKKTRGRRKEQLDALKSKINRLDDKLSKVVQKNEAQPQKELEQENKEQLKEKAPEPEVVQTEQAAKVEKTKKKLNRAELKQKIEQFNNKLIQIQQEQEAEPATETPAPAQPAAEVGLPAYLKFKDLADENLDQTSTLTLPKSYSLLLDSFKGSDTIVKFLFNRDEICTFLKLRMGIQNITKHTFTIKHLGQIKTVYSEAYNFKQEKMFIDFKNDYHLIISPNLNEIETNPDTGIKQFTPNVLLKRLYKFKTNLFQMVKKLHQEFLESIGIKEVKFQDIKRWHQKFDLENLKEIEEAELPKPPNDDSIKCKTGQELLNIAKTIYSSRIQEAIKTTVVSCDKKLDLELVVDSATTKTTNADKNNQNEMKSVQIQVVQKCTSNEKLDQDQQTLNKLKEKKETTYNSLLEKIRNKEKQKAFENMIINSDKEKTLAKYGNFKDTIRLVSFYFQAEKKSTIELEKVTKKMAENLKSKLTEAECKELISEMSSDDSSVNLFMDGAKKWLNIIKVRNIQYIQMDKTFLLNDLCAICEKAIDKIK